MVAVTPSVLRRDSRQVRNAGQMSRKLPKPMWVRTDSAVTFLPSATSLSAAAGTRRFQSFIERFSGKDYR
jgi:hypothetical protein